MQHRGGYEGKPVTVPFYILTFGPSVQKWRGGIIKRGKKQNEKQGLSPERSC